MFWSYSEGGWLGSFHPLWRAMATDLKRLLAGFEALSGVWHVRTLRIRRIRCSVWGPTRSRSWGVSGFMIWNIQEAVVKQFVHFPDEILGSCCEAFNCFIAISRRLLWSHLHIFQMKSWWFWNLKEVAVQQLIVSQQFPGSCWEAICTLFIWNIDGFGIAKRLL